MDKKEDGKIKYEYIYCIRFIKKISLALLIYFIGYFNFSLTWIVVPVIIDILRYKQKNELSKKRDLTRAAALTSEKQVIENISDLPAWVFFPDVERVEWLNKIIKQLWPNVNHYARDLIKDSIEGVLRENLEKYKIPGFNFERLVLGSVPFRLGGVIVYENISRDEIVMDMDIAYAGDCDITFKLSKMKGGIKNFQLYGKLRVVVKPLIKTLPLAGGLQAFFLNPPTIDFDFGGIAGVLEVPGINDILRKTIKDTISSMMVLPNKFPIKLSETVTGDQMKTPNPKGVLRIHVVEAKHLMKKDISITGKSKSDPYTVLEIGNQKYRTETINNTVNPKWDFWCEFIIEETDGQKLFLHLWDKDPTDDESLGKTSVEVSSLIKSKKSDLWLTLEEATHGQIHIRCTWLSLTTEYSDLQMALQEIQTLQVTFLNSAILTVFLDSAIKLPQVKLTAKPDPYVLIQIGKQEKRTKTAIRKIDPVWEEGFVFFVTNPESDSITLKMFDSKTENELGELIYNISSLSNQQHLEFVKQPFRLTRSGAESKVVLSLHLRILKNENSEDLDEFSEKRSISGDLDKEKPLLEKQDSQFSIGASSISSDEGLETSVRSRLSTSSNSSKRLSEHFTPSSGEFSPSQINLTLRYSVHRQKLIVVVHSVANIPFKEQGDLKDVYVKLYLLPERNKETKRKTQVIKSSYNPVFDESFEFLISQDELSYRELEVSVIEDKIMKNEVLGEVLIDLNKLSLVLSHTEWFDLHHEYKKK